jgi:hypothetical protein
VINAVVVDGRRPAEVAKAYGLSKSWVCELVARYRTEGDTAFEPRSRRPATRPRQTSAEHVELVVNLRHSLTRQGFDAEPGRGHCSASTGMAADAAEEAGGPLGAPGTPPATGGSLIAPAQSVPPLGWSLSSCRSRRSFMLDGGLPLAERRRHRVRCGALRCAVLCCADDASQLTQLCQIVVCEAEAAEGAGPGRERSGWQRRQSR